MLIKIPDSVNNVMFDTANIISKYEPLRKMCSYFHNEICDVLNLVFDYWSPIDLKSDPEQSHLILQNSDSECSLKHIQLFNRSELSITVKLFLFNNYINKFNECINESISEVLKTLDLVSIDNLILDFNENTAEIDRYSNSVWNELKVLINKRKIKRFGIANLNQNSFQKIYNELETKPEIVQTNVNTHNSKSKKIERNFETFCETNQILLLKNYDRRSIFENEKISKQFLNGLFNVKWIVRYQIHVKTRGLVAAKGYLVNFSKL